MRWKKVKLGDILVRRRDSVKVLPDEQYKLVTIRLYHQGVVLRNIADGDSIKSSMSTIKAGDFILSGIDARNGAFGIVPDELNGAIVTNDFWCLDPVEGLIDREFLLFLTTTDFFDHICKQSSDGTTQRIRLQKEKFFNYEISLPNVSEQFLLIDNFKKIKFNTTQLSSQLTHQLDLVKKLRQQLLQDAIQGKLAPQNPDDEPASVLLQKIKAKKERLIKEKKLKKEKKLPPIKPEEIPFDIPVSWVWCRLLDICETIVDCPHSTPKYLASETNYYGIDTNCINEKGEIIRLRSLSKESYIDRNRRLIPKENDIVYSREGSIGLAAFIPPAKNICLGQRVMLFRPQTAINHKYLKFVITEEKYKSRLLAKYRGMGAKHINVGDITASLICVPPLAEQNQIVIKIEQLMQTCDELEASIKQSRQQNEQLLQQVLREALTGNAN